RPGRAQLGAELGRGEEIAQRGRLRRAKRFRAGQIGLARQVAPELPRRSASPAGGDVALQGAERVEGARQRTGTDVADHPRAQHHEGTDEGGGQRQEQRRPRVGPELAPQPRAYVHWSTSRSAGRPAWAVTARATTSSTTATTSHQT